MPKYLIRAGFDPANYKQTDPVDCLYKIYVGGNAGNLMFAYGVMNVLQTEDTELAYSYNWAFTDEEIEKINSTYDAYILPLADAFRPGFTKQLKSLSAAVRKFRIPVVVIGIAVRTDYEPDFTRGFEFDEAAAEFVKAVRGTGTVLGVRGSITAKYLSKLGFREGTDFVPIGCPSVYTYGLGTTTREPSSDIKRLVMNTNGYYDIGHINEFLINTFDAFPDTYLVQQIRSEFREMFIGRKWLPAFIDRSSAKEDKMIITGERLNRLYKEDRVRFFLDIHSWINFMRGADLFVGNRFHGAVAAVLAGLPHVMIPFNARTRELTEWHHFTSLKPDEVRAGTSVRDYLDCLDFSSFNAHRRANLDNYISFLEKNGLEHIFREKLSYEQGESPLEKRISRQTGLDVTKHSDIIRCYKSMSFGKRFGRAFVCNIKMLKPSNFKALTSKAHGRR